MTGAAAHVVIAPVVLPLATAALTLLVDERRYALKGAISLVSLLLLTGTAIALLRMVDAPQTLVYRVGAWSAPFGIVLVADRLSALMVLLACVLALGAFTFSLARWHRAAPRFHGLVHILLMGVNGAFLTGDLFNLFVFFEVFLAASYGLALYGSGTLRVRTSLHYLVVNLTGSLLFLVGATLIYGVTGTLNMADLALRAPHIAAGDRALLEAGAGILGIAFLLKAGMWPLSFWLPGTYAAANAPSSALFAILTKVGVYSVLRVWSLLFGEESGASAAFGADWLIVGGMATLAFGIIGVLASQDLSRVAGFSLVVSSGTLLAAVGMAAPGVTGALLYYLVASTLGVSALYLLIELIERGRNPGADMLAVTADFFGEGGIDAEEEVGIAIPAGMAVLGASFLACALVLAGLPPLPGFIAKFALFDALIDSVGGAARWTLIALLTVSGLAFVIAMGRAGLRIFWTPSDRTPARVRLVEIAPVVVLIGVCFALTAYAGPVLRYVNDTAQALHAPRAYINEVLVRP